MLCQISISAERNVTNSIGENGTLARNRGEADFGSTETIVSIPFVPGQVATREFPAQA
jgi:hypothetical protein